MSRLRPLWGSNMNLSSTARTGNSTYKAIRRSLQSMESRTKTVLNSISMDDKAPTNKPGIKDRPFNHVKDISFDFEGDVDKSPITPGKNKAAFTSICMDDEASTAMLKMNDHRLSPTTRTVNLAFEAM